MKKFWQKTIENGFSLLEIVVTIALLVVSLAAIISVANKMLQVEHITENDFVAKGLLIEALALAEAKRNANVAATLPFYTDLATSTVDGSIYRAALDYNYTWATSTAINLPEDNARLKYNDTDFYQLGTGADTKFYRKIVTTYYTANTGSLWVEAQVYWADRGGKGNLQKLTAVLYNTAY